MWHDDRNREGTLLYESGSKYVGQLKNNQRHGEGTYIYPNLEELNEANEKYPYLIKDDREFERILFSGEWEEDAKVRGVIIYRNGDKYEGQLYNDHPHGKGVRTCHNGEVYEGDFLNNEMNGSGIYAYHDGSKYDGNWQNNKRNGIGEMKYSNGITYKGSFAND